MTTRRLILAAPLLLAPLPPMASRAFAHPNEAPKAADAERMIEEVKAFREKLAKAVTARDFATLRACYAESFTHTHGSGKIDNKDARLVSAMAAEPMIENAVSSELTFRVHTGPTVIVAGRSPILNVKEQKPYDFRWVTVYVTALSGWQLAVSQATRLAV